jgi:rhamnosyltransferase
VIWAKENNYEWVLLFDQDTVVSCNLVSTLSGCYTNIEASEKVGIIGAGYSDKREKEQSSGIADNLKEVKFVITSGSLISINVLDDVGQFKDDLFIDFVDIEYCLRAHKKGYKILQLETSLMQHKIGSETTHKMIWKDTATSNHSPLRRYFMMRNNIIVVKEYIFIYPRWAFASLFERLISTIKMCLFERERIPKLKYSVMGFIDGITGRYNRFKIN